MSNAWFEDSLEKEVIGRASFEWLDDVFVVFRLRIGQPPDAVCVIGHSDAEDEYVMLYHDDRGVARVFDMVYDDERWTLNREDSDFYQRFQGRLDGDTIIGAWEASDDQGQTWRKDFDLRFDRVGTDPHESVN
jgi:hypothetical protein